MPNKGTIAGQSPKQFTAGISYFGICGSRKIIYFR